MRRKITIVGAGNVGATAAHCCLTQGLGDVVLLDTAENIARGKALDLKQAAVLEGHGGSVKGTGDYKDTADSGIVVVTAGQVRKPGMTRDDLLKVNSGIIKQVVRDAAHWSPGAFFIIVTNPVDTMSLIAMEAGSLPPNRIIGLSGVLDGARMCATIADLAGVPAGIVNGVVVGEHGNAMVPLPRLATIGGVPVPAILSEEQMATVCEKTTGSGAEIVSLLGYSAYYAPGAAVASMAEAVLWDRRSILCCSAFVSGQFGADGLFMGVPIRLGGKGVLSIIELDLNAGEQARLEKSIASIRANIKVAGQEH